MGLFKQFKKLVGDERGNALAIGAAAMPLVIAGAGLALDTVQISLAKRQLQRSADSAAIAGAYAVTQGRTAQDGVTRDLELNNEVTLDGSAVVENAPVSGAYAGDSRAVRVRLSTRRQLSFLSFFGADEQEITVEATAASILEGEFCMLALEDGTDTGVSLTGNSDVNIGCGISSNSRAAEAITARGSSSITASPIMAVGGVPASGNFASGTEVIPYASPQEDPYGDLPDPTLPSTCVNGPSVGPQDTLNLSSSTPGYNASTNSYCFNGGWDIKGTVTIPAGATIYINGGELSFGSQAHVTGTSVAFILTSSNATSNPSSVATLGMNGGAYFNLGPQTSGTYANVLFYQDRRAPLGRTISFNGNSSSEVQGALYFPRTNLQFNGTTGMITRCIQLVARRLEFSGNGSVINQCDEGTANRGFQGQFVRLVG
jgi:hypothetical protein